MNIPGDPDSRPLREFLLNAAALSDPAYADYVGALPQPFKRFPEALELSKRRILINQRKITFTKESLDDLADEGELQVLFVTKNIESYLDEPDVFALDDDFLENLLQTEMTDEQKASVIGLIDLGTVVNLPKRAALLGPIMETEAADRHGGGGIGAGRRWTNVRLPALRAWNRPRRSATPERKR